MLSNLFPKTANNDYQGSVIAKWALVAFSLLFTGRSLIHYFKDDGGANSIASIVTFPGNPDPDQVIYLIFSLWGAQQLVTVFVMWIVLWRYRTLIPLMFLAIVLEQLTRIGSGLMKGLSPEYYLHAPPGAAANLPLLAIALIMLFLSLKQPKMKPE